MASYKLTWLFNLSWWRTLSLTLYRATFLIIGLGFFFRGPYFPILWDLSISSTVIISSFMFSQVVLTAASSVTSSLLSGIPYRSIDYCSCLSICVSKIAILSCIFKALSSKMFVFSSFYFLSFSYSSNLALIKSTDSCNLFMRILPLNWLSCVVLTIAVISLKLRLVEWIYSLRNISPHSDDCKLPVKTSSNDVLFKRKESLKLLLLVLYNRHHHLTGHWGHVFLSFNF